MVANINIKDVAAKAGVSIATVSNFINQTKPVSVRTEQRIKAAIEALNYAPNLLAKGLKARISNDIGVILPNLNDSYYTQIFQGIAREFQNSKYFLNLAFSNNIPEIERKIANNFFNKKVCGLILITSIPDDWRYYYDRFISQNLPIVLIDRLIYNLDCSFITFNNSKIIEHLVEQLFQAGKTNIQLLTGPRVFSCDKDCIDGFERAYKKAGLEMSENQIIANVLYKEDAFRQLVRSIQNLKPDAVITTSEPCAQGAIESLTLLGYTQEELPVIALSEEHWNRYTHSFASTSVLRPAIQMGATAALTLKNELQSPKTHEKTVKILNSPVAQSNVSPLKEASTSIIKPRQRRMRALLLDIAQTTALRDFLPNFEKSTGINVDIEVLPHQYLLERIMHKHFIKENQPDIFMFDTPWLYDLASAGILEDITNYIKDKSFDESIFLPGCLKYYSEFQGRYYGLPILYSPQILYYRKDLFENAVLGAEYAKQFRSKLIPPRTWKEFLAIAEFFTTCEMPENTVKYGTSMPAAYKECLVPEIYVRLFSYGGNIFDNLCKVVFNSPQTLKAYVNFKQTIKYCKPDYLSANDTSVAMDFADGDTAMLITFPSILNEATELHRLSLTGKIGYSLIPGYTTLLGGWSIGINSHSEKKDEAFRFLSWTATNEIATCITLMEGQTAVNSIFENDELVTLYPWLPLYKRAYQDTVPRLPPYLNGKQIASQKDIDSIIYHHALALLHDKQDVTDTIAKTHFDLSNLFEKKM